MSTEPRARIEALGTVSLAAVPCLFSSELSFETKRPGSVYRQKRIPGLVEHRCSRALRGPQPNLIGFVSGVISTTLIGLASGTKHDQCPTMQQASKPPHESPTLHHHAPLPHDDHPHHPPSHVKKQNPVGLPGALVVLAAEAGDGWVPLGPTAAKAGRKVATVFEDPSVVASDVEIFRTATHELQITGTGFNKVSRPVLDFEPPIDSGDYYVDVSRAWCWMIAAERASETTVLLSLRTVRIA